MTRLSIIVPTADGEGLEALFTSVVDQLHSGDQILVIGDTHDGPLESVRDLVESQGYRYLAHDAGHHCWGHCQINEGMTWANGDYLIFIDDDDCFPDGALDVIRSAAATLPSPRPMIFQFYSRRHGRTLPPTHEVRESAIGGHCLVAPNIPAKLGRWSERYAGDFDFIVSTLALWPDGPAWFDDVIACA